MEGKKAIVQRMYRRYVKKIQNIQEIRVVMFEEWNKFLFHNFIYFYREDIRSTETTRSRYVENFHRMEENFKYWREIFEHFRVTGGHPLGT